MSIHSDTIIDAMEDSLGEGKAQEVFQQASKQTGLARQDELSKEEALDIVTEIAELDDVSTFVEVSANTLKTRIHSGTL
jgi:hypothetical protein